MPEQEEEQTKKAETKTIQPSPLIFISHDSRDAELAEAFSKLLRSISAGMLKSFRSSDKKGTEGIEFGDDWYNRLMTKLDSASDVVCLLTDRSLERPWILYEAGVAKGKLKTPVFGVALGIPFSKVNIGPFYQFQNCDDSVDSLTKLVMQLASRIPSCEPEKDIVRSLVQNFKSKTEEITSNIAEPGVEAEEETPSDSATAKLFEELKVMFRDLPSRVEEHLSDYASIKKRRIFREFHPKMFEEIMDMDSEDDAISILFFASLIRDDVPWLYEIAIEAFRTITSVTKGALEDKVEQMKRLLELLKNFPKRGIVERFGMYRSKETHILIMEGPRMLEKMISRYIETFEKSLQTHIQPRRALRRE